MPQKRAIGACHFNAVVVVEEDDLVTGHISASDPPRLHVMLLTHPYVLQSP